jgi:hypothetical protein
MKNKHVPLWGALGWGFRELAGHLPALIPLSALFFAPEICEKFGHGWPIWASEIFKTALFFVLLLRAMKATQLKNQAPAKGNPRAFATGEILKMIAQVIAALVGASVLAAWLALRDPGFLGRIFQGSLFEPSPASRWLMAWHWWLNEPLWDKALTLFLAGWLPLRAHVLFNFFGYIVAEKGCEAPQALRESMRLGKGVQVPLLFFYALCLALNVVGFKLYIIGAIFTFPATVLATVYVYRALAVQEGP